jgi:hypothetical protein
MTAYIISSGWSCGRAVFNLFLERFDGYFGNSINPEYSVYGNNPEGRQRLRLTIQFVLVQGVGKNRRFRGWIFFSTEAATP